MAEMAGYFHNSLKKSTSSGLGLSKSRNIPKIQKMVQNEIKKNPTNLLKTRVEKEQFQHDTSLLV